MHFKLPRNVLLAPLPPSSILISCKNSTLLLNQCFVVKIKTLNAGNHTTQNKTQPVLLLDDMNKVQFV